MSLDSYLEKPDDAPRGLMARSSDVLLAGLIVAIIALMILPMPAIMVDVLVAVNIAMGLMLVLMGIYISNALQFSAFPSVLLITTLFRLALSVATTRMILLHGDAGHIIDTFGNMVAGGNLVVGLVVFMIITVVQFLVIAKGAERVAEVGARFTLDAMPGKQLSIDSDLRSGLIDKLEARAKRREVELESKLHGSMDGAMKFVKGDAIAGIVIILVNLIGGLAIGVFQLQMSAGNAMQKYSILTIGDGLVTQIPALLAAMAAGLIVTRSTDTTADLHLGDSIQKQFAATPRVLVVAGGICFLMALVPGFPSSVFILLGMFLALTGAALIPALRSRMDKMSPVFSRVMDGKATAQKRMTPTQTRPVQQALPLLLEVPPGLVAGHQGDDLRDAVTRCVERYQLRSGVPMPEIHLHARADEQPEWTLHAFEVPMSSGAVTADTTIDTMAAEVEVALRKQGTLFLGLQESGQLLTHASIAYPDIVKEALRSIGAPNLATILRSLVSEEISIRDLRGILEGLIQAASHEKDLANLAEWGRIAQSRQISHRHAPAGTLRALVLAPPLEAQLASGLRKVGTSEQLSLDPAVAQRIQSAAVEAARKHQPAAILTSVRLRRHVRELLAHDLFEVPVLSFSELEGGLKIQTLEQLRLPDVQPLASVQ